MKGILSVFTSAKKSTRFKLFAALLAGVLSVTLVSAPQVFAAEKQLAKAEVVKVKVQSKVNINSASIEDLTSLKGIGEKKAIAIVKHRNQHGKFKSVEQLAEVKGIGASIVEKNRALMTL